MSRQTHASKFDAFAVRNCAIWLHGFVCQVVTPEEIPLATLHHEFPIELASDDLRAGAAFEFCEYSAVIEMGMAVQQDLDVPWLWEESPVVCGNLRKHLEVAGVEKNISRRSGDQE